MLSGSLSDRFGRRRVFQIGLVLFTAGSLLCSMAPSIGQLIGFRALQGLGASMLNPVALSIIANAFREPKARAHAVGIWGAVAGISLAIGPLIGGALTQAVGWRSIFWINLPIGITAVALAARFVPESKAPRARAFDPVGQLLVFISLASSTTAVIEGPHTGWTSWTIVGLFVTAGAALGLFLFYEPRRKDPLVDLRFFHSIPFSSATLLALCAFASFAGFLFLNALYLQQARGFSAFHTGVVYAAPGHHDDGKRTAFRPVGGPLRYTSFVAGRGWGLPAEHVDAHRAEYRYSRSPVVAGLCVVWTWPGHG